MSTRTTASMPDERIEVRPLVQITGEAEFNEVFLTDAVVAGDAMIGDLGAGWAVANTTLMHERAGLGAGGGSAGAPTVMPGTIAAQLDRRVGDVAPAPLATTPKAPRSGGRPPSGAKQLADLARSNGRIADPTIRQDLVRLHTLGELGRFNTLRVKAAKAAGVNPINHWLGLLVYQDHFVQISMVMPSASMAKLRKPADQLITHLLHCIRYPSLVPEMIKLGQRYLEQPLKDAGRQAADSLLTLSKESPVFEVVVPGEALTPCIEEVNKQSPQSALDLLRGFIVGSSLATLKGGSTEASLDEGARGMIKACEALRAQKQPVHSIFLEELRKAVEEKRAATFLQDKMRTAASVR